eukprot:GHVU01096714.1.p1 GENE.GHVU01096714.1~~GHVU01096714.1.p1  ORF type:complete len:101 (+),score=3.96 GHVU01096714.1:30-305(+)
MPAKNLNPYSVLGGARLAHCMPPHELHLCARTPVNPIACLSPCTRFQAVSLHSNRNRLGRLLNDEGGEEKGGKRKRRMKAAAGQLDIEPIH